MGILAAYCYFFEPYYPQAFDEHVIESIFSIFPARHIDDGWVSKFPNVIYESRRI